MKLKDAVDGESCGLLVRRVGEISCDSKDRIAQVIDALSSHCGDFEERGVLERSLLQFAADIGAHKRKPIGIDKVDFGEDDQALVDAQKVTDGEMFACLGHDAFVGSDHHHHKVDTACARHHRTDQALVSRDIDHADLYVFCGERGKAEFDGDPATFFFGEAVGVVSRERMDKTAFSMIDMSGCSEDSVLHAMVSLLSRWGCGLRIF